MTAGEGLLIQPGERSRQPATAIPWSDLGILYALLAVLIFVDCAVVLAGHYQVIPGALWNDTAYALLFIVVGAFYAISGRSPTIASLLFVVAALVVGGPAGLVLDFVTKAMGYPLADPVLAAWDARLGLDWVAYERWFSGHAGLSLAAGMIYSGSTIVLLIAFIVLAGLGRLRLLTRLAIAAALTIIASITIGGFFPAAGPHHFYGVGDGGKAYWVDTIIRVATERPKLIVLNGQPPLTTFPSFHTTIAVLVILGCWPVRRFGWIFALLNAFWVLAIPVWGSHYFIDMIAGALIGLAGFGLATVLQSLADRDWRYGTGTRMR